MTGHTPGPWTRGDDGGDIIWGPEWQGHKVHVAGVPFSPGDTRIDADARLIAAAPEMLAALEGSVMDLEFAVALAGEVNELRAAAISLRLASVRAAIAKATGAAK